jgi:hypothetical protein
MDVRISGNDVRLSLQVQDVPCCQLFVVLFILVFAPHPQFFPSFLLRLLALTLDTWPDNSYGMSSEWPLFAYEWSARGSHYVSGR